MINITKKMIALALVTQLVAPIMVLATITETPTTTPTVDPKPAIVEEKQAVSDQKNQKASSLPKTASEQAMKTAKETRDAAIKKANADFNSALTLLREARKTAVEAAKKAYRDAVGIVRNERKALEEKERVKRKGGKIYQKIEKLNTKRDEIKEKEGKPVTGEVKKTETTETPKKTDTTATPTPAPTPAPAPKQ